MIPPLQSSASGDGVLLASNDGPDCIPTSLSPPSGMQQVSTHPILHTILVDGSESSGSDNLSLRLNWVSSGRSNGDVNAT